MKLLIRELFFCFGILCFFALCIYPAFSFFIEKKSEFYMISGIELVNYSRFAFGVLMLFLFAGIIAFMRIKKYRKKDTSK